MEGPKGDPFWLNHLAILFDPLRATEIVPTPTMSDSEQFNAMARFSIYCGIAVALYKRDVVFVGLIAVPVLALTLVLHLQTPVSAAAMQNQKAIATVATKNYVPGSLVTQYDKPTVRYPTINNPFMNLTFADVGNDQPPSRAADVNDPVVRQAMKTAFQADLVPADDDLYNNKQSQLIFNHVDMESVPDTLGFALWLFPDANRKTSKENGSNFGPMVRDPSTGKYSLPAPPPTQKNV